jgi:hypothetical protein
MKRKKVTFMAIEISIFKKDKEFEINLTWNGICGTLLTPKVQIAHLGCSLLGTVKQISTTQAKEWDNKFGKPRTKTWKQAGVAKECMAATLAKVGEISAKKGIVLKDTMRNGSDYWRPGKFLSDVTILLSDGFTLNDQSFSRSDMEVTYARDDYLCPPTSLLQSFMAPESTMTFGEYAEIYAIFLRKEHRLLKAAAEIVLDLLKGNLPIFYCTDPYIPGYGSSREFLSDIPYVDRRWHAGLRKEGCHRVILVEEIAKLFRQFGMPVEIYELNQTFCEVKTRFLALHH